MCVCIFLSVCVQCPPLSAATSKASEGCQEGSLLCPGGPIPALPRQHRQAVPSGDSLGPSSRLPPVAAPHLPPPREFGDHPRFRGAWLGETRQRPNWAQKVQTLALSRWGSRRREK